MLRKLHNKKIQKRIWIVLLVLILPGFIIWGFSSSLRSPRQQDRGHGKIFNQNINEEQYLAALQAIETQLRMQLGENYLQYQKLFDLNSMALQRLVMLYEADKRKIKISDSELIDFIQKDPSFYRKGVFDENLYGQIIKYSLHLQPRFFEEMTRQNLKISKLMQDITKGLKLTDAQVKEAYNKENEQMSVYYISSIPADLYPDQHPSEAELTEYFGKNSLQFKKPLSFNLEYLSWDPAGQVKDLNLRISRKDSLETIAKDNNIVVKETGLFAEVDPIPGIGWSKEISKSLGAAKTGELIGPLEIEKKTYLFRLKAKKEPYIPEFKDIKEEVQAGFVKMKARELARSKIDECAKKIKELSATDVKSLDFDKIAKDFSLKSASTGLFKSGSYIEGIGASDEFFNTAKSLKENAASDVIELPSGFYIVRLKEKPALDEKKFSEDKVKFEEKLLKQKKDEYLEKFFAELLKKALGS